MNDQSRFSDITFCITSCGRLDLLSATLESMMRANGHAFARKLLHEDAGDADVIAFMQASYPDFEIVTSSERQGNFGSIDRLYEHVTTPYIFQCEDDWGFDDTDAVARARAVLEAEPKASVVSLRKIEDLPPKSVPKLVYKQADGVKYALMPANAHPEWFGYTTNPSILRRALWEKYGPFREYVTEERISMAIKRDGLTIAYLVPGACYHIGAGRHVDDPTQPLRAKTRLQKLRRSVQKRWRRLLRAFGVDA